MLIVDNESQVDLEGSSSFVSASSLSSLSEFSHSILSNESRLGEEGPLSVEVDCEVTMFEGDEKEPDDQDRTNVNDDSFSDRVMARSKQTLRKSGQDYNKYHCARFGKPGGKATKHLAAKHAEDNNNDKTSSSSTNSDTSKVAYTAANRGNPVVRNAIQEGQRR